MTQHPDQLPLPLTFEGPPDPRPKPDRRQSIAIARKPTKREVAVEHPASEVKSA